MNRTTVSLQLENASQQNGNVTVLAGDVAAIGSSACGCLNIGTQKLQNQLFFQHGSFYEPIGLSANYEM